MRLTDPRFKHNLLRMAKATWQAQSKRKVINLEMEKYLKGKTIYEASEIAVLPKENIDHINPIINTGPMAPVGSERPDYNEVRCLVFKDKNILVGGLQQAKLLTNTIEPQIGLPTQLVSLIDAISHPKQNKLAKRSIMGSLVYDAEQVKLPKRKDPERPAWVFRRDYGICDQRRNSLICTRFLQLCELISSSRVSQERLIVNDAVFNVPIKWNNYKILFNVRADLLLASASALAPITSSDAFNEELPDITPLLPVVSIEEDNIYEYVDKYPLQSGPQGASIHTAFIYYNESELRNLYGTPVEEDQILGRTVLKSYAFAVAQARQNYGEKISGPLSVPVTIQIVHTNGKWFQFGVFQLNTLDIEDTSIRNYFWSTPLVNLYSFCGYEEGRPDLRDYDPDVFKTFLAMYNNGS